LLAWWWLSVAQAQAVGDFVDDEAVLSAAAVQGADNWAPAVITSVGSPAVFVDPEFPFVDLPLMFYETQVAPGDAACPAGRWGIGVAYNSVFFGWQDAGPVVQPTPGTFYSCVAAHPTVVPLGDPVNRQWVVYFKAELDESSCTPNPDFDCDRYPGVGRFVFQANAVGTLTGGTVGFYSYSDIDDSPVLSAVAQDMGYPSAVFADGQYRMAFAQNPDVFVTSSPFTAFYGTPSAPAAEAGTAPGGWEADELYSPSLVCEGSSPAVDYLLFVGGRVFTTFPDVGDASLGLYTSIDFSSFAEDPGSPYLSYAAGDPELRHIDVHTNGGGTSHGAFYASPNGGGGNDIRLASTSGFSQLALDPKRCP